MMVEVCLCGVYELCKLVSFEEILCLNIKYIGTDFDCSGYSLYEDNITGEIYAVNV